MDPFEPQPEQPDLLQPRPAPAPVAPAVEELQQQAQDFRLLFNATFLGLIALCLAVNLMLGKQWFMVRRELQRKEPLITRDEAEFRRNTEPVIRQFMVQLHEYASTHREFQTNILDRYRRALPGYFTTAAVVGQPGGSPGLNRPPGQ